MHSPGVRVASSGSIPSPPKRESQQGSAQKTSSGSGDNATKGESARKKLSLRQVEVLEEVFQMDPAGVPGEAGSLADAQQSTLRCCAVMTLAAP